MDRIECATANDDYFDFCLWPYRPPAVNGNKYRGSTLLFHSFELAGASDRIYEIVKAIRDAIGVSRTVWGVKRMTGSDELFWEFYFYDYERADRSRSISAVQETIKPFIDCNVCANENLHYFMFSFELDTGLIAGNKGLDEIHMYIGNPGSEVSSGICYSLTAERTAMENFYFFFEADKHREDILAKLVCSAHVDFNRVAIEKLMWPEMEGCEVVVVANKQENDALYFSRINIDQLIFFLKKLDYPAETVTFVESNRGMFDHLLFDVGFDYRLEGDELIILKSAYYGIF